MCLQLLRMIPSNENLLRDKPDQQGLRKRNTKNVVRIFNGVRKSKEDKAISL